MVIKEEIAEGEVVDVAAERAEEAAEMVIGSALILGMICPFFVY